MDKRDTSLSPAEHEWRTCVTVIQAAAEILRDYDGMALGERQRFLQAIIDGNGRLTRTCERMTAAG
jgi:signal transduction histidine kinase